MSIKQKEHEKSYLKYTRECELFCSCNAIWLPVALSYNVPSRWHTKVIQNDFVLAQLFTSRADLWKEMFNLRRKITENMYRILTKPGKLKHPFHTTTTPPSGKIFRICAFLSHRRVNATSQNRPLRCPTKRTSRRHAYKHRCGNANAQNSPYVSGCYTNCCRTITQHTIALTKLSHEIAIATMWHSMARCAKSFKIVCGVTARIIHVSIHDNWCYTLIYVAINIFDTCNAKGNNFKDELHVRLEITTIRIVHTFKKHSLMWYVLASSRVKSFRSFVGSDWTENPLLR